MLLLLFCVLRVMLLPRPTFQMCFVSLEALGCTVWEAPPSLLYSQALLFGALVHPPPANFLPMPSLVPLVVSGQRPHSERGSHWKRPHSGQRPHCFRIVALWKGLLPTWARLGPWQMAFWVAYEKLRNATGTGNF